LIQRVDFLKAEKEKTRAIALEPAIRAALEKEVKRGSATSL